MKNVLFVVYEFPPLNSGGSHRPYRFLKFLGQYGINPVVVTPEVEESTSDRRLLEALDKNIKIIRTPLERSGKLDSLLSKNYVNILGTEAKRWKKHLFPVLEKLTTETAFDAMYVTAPPFSIADLGVEASKKFGIPLVLDMRDHWSHWNITPFTSYLHYRLILRKEGSWFKHAVAVLAVTEQMVEDFETVHADVDKQKFHTVRNSYPSEIRDLRETVAVRKATKEKPLKIGYVGSFYYHPYQRKLIFDKWWQKKPHQWLQYTPRQEDWLYRSPYFFFQALKTMLELYPELASLVRVEFIGAKPEWLVAMIDESGLRDIVALKGFLPHSESIAFQEGCDALLGTSMKVVGGKDYCIAGKSYEYIALQKPVLAFMTEGAQKTFFEASGMSVILDADDIEHNAEKLRKFILGEVVLHPQKKFMEQINSKHTTDKLASIIKKVAK